MKMEQLGDHCYAVLNENNRLCDVNSGFINLAGGVVIDTQSDLTHAQRMIELFGTVAASPAKRVVNTHEDADHVWGNQLFPQAEIIGHRSLPERMRHVANPGQSQWLMWATRRSLIRIVLRATLPGVAAVADQLREDYDFDRIELTPPTTLFDEKYELDLNGVAVHLIYVGPCHQQGDILVHVPSERLVFSGDVLFRQCTPIGWSGTYASWINCLDLIISLDPEVILPGHGPVCDIGGVQEMKSYLQYVRAESEAGFNDGLSVIQTAKRIDLGPYADWKAPSRLYFNVERAYREFRGQPPDKPWNVPASFNRMYRLARARDWPIEF